MHGLIVKPPTYTQGRSYPTLLRIHGGPNGQDEHAFNFERELFAANGYVVVAVNYRGSNGRGSAYQKAIFADWGNKEVVDLLGAMDHVEKTRLRRSRSARHRRLELRRHPHQLHDRDRRPLQGGDQRRRQLESDLDVRHRQYIQQYEQELGPPWKSQDLWIKLSYPFFHADRIKTPTLFMGGEKDFNVPLLGSEQMYQALRAWAWTTELVIYPGQFHGITTPSYQEGSARALPGWYEKYLKPSETSEARR